MMISWKHLEILHQLMQHQHGTTKRLKKLIAAVLTDIEVDSTLEEWVAYTHEDIPENWNFKEQATDKTTYYRVDHYCKNVFQLRNSSGQPKFMKLQKFIHCLLTISHGNAHVERSLSHNKNVLTSERSSLSPEVFSKSGFVSMIRRRGESTTMGRSWIKLRIHKLEASENCFLELM